MFDERAQLHTLEGVAAATLLLMVIIYAIDATSMTPLTSSTANVHVESELAELGQDILNTLDYTEPGHNSKLKNDILNWNGREYLWNGSYYVENGGNISLKNNLTEILNNTLIRQGIAHKVELTYLISTNNITMPSAPEKMIYSGVPSDNAVVVSRKIALQMSDVIDILPKIKPIDPDTDLYNIVDVKLILWRS